VPYFEKAVQLAPHVIGVEDLTTADLHNRLGLLYYHTSRYALAEAQFRHALRIREGKLGKDDPLVVESLNNLAIQLKEQGRYEAAKAPLLRALEIQERVSPGELIHAKTLDNLAFLYRKLDRETEAGELFKQALKIRRAKFGDDHPETAYGLRNVAEHCEKVRNFKDARKHYQESLEILEDKLKPQDRKIAIGLDSLAGLELAEGKPAAALPWWTRCLKIQRTNGWRDDPEVSVGQVLNDVAFAHGCLGEWKKAHEAMDEAQGIELTFINDSLPAQSEVEQLLYLKYAFEPALHRGLSLGVAARTDPQLCARSAEWLLNGKGVAHQALAARALLARDRQDPAIAALADQLTAIREERARLAYLSRGGQGGEDLARKRAEAARKEQELVKEIGVRRGRSEKNAGVTVQQVRAALPGDAVLIEVARFRREMFKAGSTTPREERYAVWVIPALGKGDVHIVDLGPAGEIDTAVAAVRRALQQGPGKVQQLGEEKAEKELLGPLEALSRLVVQPLIESIGKSRRWIIGPDGDLWLVPWAALRLPGGRYVIEDHEVSYVVSGRDLAATVKAARAGPPLLFADPDYDLELSAKAAEPAVVASWQRLPGTAVEAEAVSPALAKLAGVAPRVLLGAEARERVFKASPNPRFLVMSTHGFFLADQAVAVDGPTRGGFRGVQLEEDDAPARPAPRLSSALENPLLRCGLILAGANRRSTDRSGEDGVLTGLEIVGADLRGTELVVLSACETGLGQVHQGEGVAGLRQAFQLAGAKAVAATLWKVADRETAQLVGAFFDQMAQSQAQPAEALRSAQRMMIDQRRRQHGAAHPYFWAAFTLTGR
jgi:CHAT domain-containing protein/Tfp pilus assembly protein PilF